MPEEYLFYVKKIRRYNNEESEEKYQDRGKIGEFQ